MLQCKARKIKSFTLRHLVSCTNTTCVEQTKLQFSCLLAIVGSLPNLNFSLDIKEAEMGKLFGNMWSSVSNHYGMTPLALTDNPEVWISSFNVLSVLPLFVKFLVELPFSDYGVKNVCWPDSPLSSDPCCVLSRYWYGGGGDI